ncbi:MAG: MogA/MoaB family molybdenum cofactor biosynthesis protein [Planctomycetota bacterium]|jgi:molybdenum cofactor synthesis domain-containing protein
MIRAAVITVSDRSHRGEREDRTGPALAEALAGLPAEVVGKEVVPDEREEIAAAIVRQAGRAELVLTAGGTGVAARDTTPEATRDVVEREVPGMGEEMRRRSLEITPAAVLSRATAGTIGRTLVLNLPGSPSGAVECLTFLREAVLHAVDMLGREAADCQAERREGP